MGMGFGYLKNRVRPDEGVAFVDGGVSGRQRRALTGEANTVTGLVTKTRDWMKGSLISATLQTFLSTKNPAGPLSQGMSAGQTQRVEPEAPLINR
jgi:hypothetical protein